MLITYIARNYNKLLFEVAFESFIIKLLAKVWPILFSFHIGEKKRSVEIYQLMYSISHFLDGEISL